MLYLYNAISVKKGKTLVTLAQMHFLGAFEEDIYPCNCAIERKYSAHLSSCQKHCYWSSTQSCKAHKIKCNFSHYEPDVFICILSTYWLEKFMVMERPKRTSYFFYFFWRYLLPTYFRCTVLSVPSTGPYLPMSDFLWHT